MSFVPDRETTIETSRGKVLLIYGKMGLLTSTGKPQCKGFVIKDAEDRLAITINSSYPEEMQEKALRHELLHIDLGHLDDANLLTVDECEAEVDSAMGETL